MWNTCIRDFVAIKSCFKWNMAVKLKSMQQQQQQQHVNSSAKLTGFCFNVIVFTPLIYCNWKNALFMQLHGWIYFYINIASVQNRKIYGYTKMQSHHETCQNLYKGICRGPVYKLFGIFTVLQSYWDYMQIEKYIPSEITIVSLTVT